jgi:hypothetical protein
VWRLVLTVEAENIEAWATALTVEWRQSSNILTVREDGGYAPRAPEHTHADAVKAIDEMPLAAEPQQFWEQRKMLPDTDIQK